MHYRATKEGRAHCRKLIQDVRAKRTAKEDESFWLYKLTHCLFVDA